ncbi:unnamed protein product [Heligmosomoides polygyrus]|uniref:1-alkyl-2-acetylglycerophosphocholine esterase n=1 Tax=Heligmosomoides polygyrus TaxID=6339 RepID=A0A183GGW0_HELPZ|nr:unnamed protein product [Heligmosomoides polygyrus]
MGAVWSYAGRCSILPLPGAGRFETACADLMVSDTKDGDTGVFMRVYYPMNSEEGRTWAVSDRPLWLSRTEYVDGLASYMKQSAGRLQFVFNWIIGETRISSLWQRKLFTPISLPNASKSPQKLVFPVVIFSHGLSGCRHFYSTYCASLASNGFIVAAVEHSDYSACWTYKLIPDSVSGRLKERQFPIRIVDKDDKRLYKIRNQQLNKRVSECVKALHVLEEINLGQLPSDNLVVGKEVDWYMFKGRMDLSRAFVAGHSFGGATAVAATAFSTDFQAAVVLDGWLFPLDSGHYERAAQPTLFLNAGRWQYLENVERMHKLRNIVEKPIYTLRFPDIAMKSIVEMSVAFLNRDQGTENDDLRTLVDLRFRDFIVDGSPSDLMNGKPG